MTYALETLPVLLRERLRPLLPERAFLRRDRGDALFVTNAPLLSDDPSWKPALEAAGFLWEPHGGLMSIFPSPDLLLTVERESPPTDFLTASLERLRAKDPCSEALRLFTRGLRLLEHSAPSDRSDYVRCTRQLAALCLRTHQGGAYACALICQALNPERSE